MRSTILAAAFVLATSAALAEDKPAVPTVVLTEAELQTLVNEQVTAALAQQAVQKVQQEARSANQKVKQAFAPKSQPAPTTHP